MIDTRNSINSSSPAGTRPASARPPAAAVSEQQAAAPAGGEVSLSERGRALQALERAVLAADTGRADRVAQVRAQVAEGSYQIDSAQLAGKLLQSDWSRQ